MIDALSYGLYEKLLYLLLLTAPLLFLSFKSSITAITLAWFFPILLSNYRPYYLIGNHFPAYVIPFLFLGAVMGMKKNIKLPHFPNLNMYTKNLLLAGLIFMVFVSPLSPVFTAFTANLADADVFFSDFHPPEINDHTKMLQRVINLVPEDAPILTQNNIFPHFSSRTNSYVYPISVYIEKAPPEAMNQYITELFEKTEFVLIDLTTDTFSSKRINKKIDLLGDYGLYAFADGIRLYKKNYQGDPILTPPNYRYPWI
jgi:uncharacterized membrane protein